MGHQARLILTPRDTAELEHRLRETNVLVIPPILPSPDVCLLLTMAIADMGGEDLLVYLAHKKDFSELQFRQLEKEEGWTVDLLRSPVVEFIRCFFDETVLRPGRLFYEDGYYGPSGAWLEKSDAFRGWAKALFREIKKNLKWRADLSGYIGPHAEKWLFEKHGRIVAN
jgi:hypothetical protein